MRCNVEFNKSADGPILFCIVIALAVLLLIWQPWVDTRCFPAGVPGIGQVEVCGELIPTAEVPTVAETEKPPAQELTD